MNATLRNTPLDSLALSFSRSLVLSFSRRHMYVPLPEGWPAACSDRNGLLGRRKLPWSRVGRWHPFTRSACEVSNGRRWAAGRWSVSWCGSQPAWVRLHVIDRAPMRQVMPGILFPLCTGCSSCSSCTPFRTRSLSWKLRLQPSPDRLTSASPARTKLDRAAFPEQHPHMACMRRKKVPSFPALTSSVRVRSTRVREAPDVRRKYVALEID